MKQIMESPLVKESIQKEIRLKLMQYDYDHDQMNELDEVLNDLKPEMIFRDSMSRMIRFMVIRGTNGSASAAERASKQRLSCGCVGGF